MEREEGRRAGGGERRRDKWMEGRKEERRKEGRHK